MVKFKLVFLSRKTFADFVLLFFSAAWGLAYPLMHIVIKKIGPIDFIMAKYFFAAIIFAPIFFFQRNNKNILRVLPYGFLLSLLYFFACLFQALGLERITAGRNAFITGLVVVVVPFLSPVFQRTYPKKADIYAIIGVLIGMYLLLDPVHSKASLEGDLLSFAGTLFFAVHLQTLQKFSKKFDEATIFSFYQVFFIPIFALISISFLGFRSHMLVFTHLPFNICLMLFILGFLVMSAFFIQAKFQPMTTPSRAVLIYNLQPAIAALFSFLILDEGMSALAITGAAIAIFSVVSSKLYTIYRDSIAAAASPQKNVS